MKTSQRGIDLIISFEGFRANAYRDVVGVLTIGYGFTKGVKLGDRITVAEARARLVRELVEYENGVLNALTIKPTQSEFDACVSLAYNIGVAGFKRSSVAKAHNRGDKQAAGRAFGLWVKAGGKTWPGLVRRRAAEAAMYLETTETEEMPQRVDNERPMTASTINRASVVAGGTATVAAVTETINTVNGLKHGVSELGDWLVPALLVCVVALAGYIVWERVKIRRQGWA